MAATEAEECVWVLDPCPQVEGANYDWFVLAAGRGGRLWIEGRCVGSAARAGPAWREIRFSGNEARLSGLGQANVDVTRAANFWGLMMLPVCLFKTRRGHDGDSDRPVCTALRIWASTMIWDLWESNNLMVRMAMQFGIGDLANP